MNVFRRVAMQSMRRNRTRTIVTIIGVILSAAMFTAVTTFAASLTKQFERTAAYENGTYYLSLLTVDHETRTSMAQDKDVEALVSGEILGYAAIDTKNENKPFLYVEAMSDGFADIMPVHLSSGRMPQNSSELLLPEHLSYNGESQLTTGDTVALALGERTMEGERLWQHDSYYPEIAETFTVRETRSYTIVGFYERPDFEDYSAPGYTALTVADAQPSTGIYDVYVRLNSPDSAVLDDFCIRYEDGVEGGISANWSYLITQGNFRYDNYGSFVISFACIFVLLIMIGSVSLIYSAFSISVSERTRQFGLLSSIGATRKQLRQTVLNEAAIVSVIGIPLGLLAGCGGMWTTFTLLGDKLSSLFGDQIPLKFYVSPFSIILATAIALITVFISAIIPARRAMRISAIEAIRQSRDVKTSGRDFASGKLAYKLFGLPGMLSKKYFRRSRKKYRATIISLAMSVLLFVSASTYGMYLTESIESSAHLPSYDLCYATSENLAEDYDRILPALRNAAGIKEAYYACYDYYDLALNDDAYSKGYLDYCGNRERVSGSNPLDESEHLPVARLYYIDDTTFNSLLAANGLTRADYDAHPGALLLDQLTRIYYNSDGTERYVYSGTVLRSDLASVQIVSREPLEEKNYVYTELENGQLISYYEQSSTDNYQEQEYVSHPAVTEELSILCRTTTAFGIGGSDDLSFYLPYSALKTPFTPELYCNVTDADQAQTSMEEVFTDYNVPFYRNNLYNALESMQDEQNILTVVRVFSYGFIVLISLICVANVFNTISTNVALRRRDFAMLRSVGMTRSGINRMVNYECLLYGVRALLIGLPLSAALTYLMYRSATSILNSDYHVSLPAVGIAIVSVFLVVFASMMYAMRKIKKDNPVDALKEENT